MSKNDVTPAVWGVRPDGYKSVLLFFLFYFKSLYILPLFRIECVGGGSGVLFSAKRPSTGSTFSAQVQVFWFIGWRKRDTDFKNAFKNISCSFLLFILRGVKTMKVLCLLLSKENINLLLAFWLFATFLILWLIYNGSSVYLMSDFFFLLWITFY